MTLDSSSNESSPRHLPPPPRKAGRGKGARAAGAFVLATAAALFSNTACIAPDAVPGGDGGNGGTAGTGGGDGGSTQSTGGAAAGYKLSWVETAGVDADADQRVLSVAATPDGGALVSGVFEGPLTFGSLPEIPWANAYDGFVALLDSAGDATRAVAFTGPGNQILYRAVPLSDGGVLLAGTFDQALIYNATDLASFPDAQDGFVARLNQDLSIEWFVPVPGIGNQTVESIALSPTGDIYVAGTFDGVLQVGNLTTAENANGRDFFVAKLAATGETVWATSLGGDPASGYWLFPSCHVVAATDGSGAYLAGTFTGSVSFGEDLGTLGNQDIFVGKLDPDGKAIWARSAGLAGGEAEVASIAVDTLGTLLLSGSVRGGVKLDANTTLYADGAETDILVAVYDPAGEVVWGRRYGSPAHDEGSAIAFDTDGSILLTGRFRGSLYFGDDTVLLNEEAISGSDDMFLARLTSSGKHEYSTAWGKWDDEVPSSMAVGPDSSVLLGGWFRGGVDFGNGDIDALNGTDLFVFKITPQGAK